MRFDEQDGLVGPGGSQGHMTDTALVYDPSSYQLHENPFPYLPADAR